MSKINYSNYESSPYGRASYRGDTTQLGGYSSDPIESYHATLRSYADSLMSFYSNLQAGDPRRQTVEAYRRQTASFAEQYRFEDILAETEGRGFGSNWDPLTGNIYGGDGAWGMGAASEPSANPGLQSDYMDSQKIFYGEKGEVSSFTADKTTPQSEIYFYNYGEMTFNIPGAAHATVAYEQGMMVATVTWPTGANKKYYFPNNKKVTFEASDSARQITLDASLPAGIAEKKDRDEGASGDSKVQGDAPSKRQDGNFGWDGSSFDIFSTSDGKDKYISARNVVNFHATSNTEYWTVEWKDGKYVVNVYDNSDTKNSKPKETFFMDDMTNLKATFDIDPTHIEFKATLGDAKDPHQINTSDSQGKKLSFADGNGSAPAHKPGEPLHAGDTPPDPNSVSNGQATWTGGSSNVEIHADPTDGVNTYNITTTGVVLLHGATPNDKVNVSEVDNSVRTITFTSPDGSIKTFKIGTPESQPLKIIIDSASDNMSGAGVDNVSLGNSFESSTSEFNDMMQALEEATGADEETILKQIGKYFPEIINAYDKISSGGDGDRKIDLNELEKAYQAGLFPPKSKELDQKSGQKLIEFIYAVAPNFKKAMDDIPSDPNGMTMAAMVAVTTNANKELVKVLQALYPDITIRAATNPPNQILFGDGVFQSTGYSLNPYTLNQILFAWIKNPLPSEG